MSTRHDDNLTLAFLPVAGNIAGVMSPSAAAMPRKMRWAGRQNADAALAA